MAALTCDTKMNCCICKQEGAIFFSKPHRDRQEATNKLQQWEL